MRTSSCRPLVLAALLMGLAASAAPSRSAFRSAADAVLRDSVPAGGPGVAVVVGRGDRVLYRGARGLADVELDVPMRVGDAFRIGSITKTVTAATVLRLAEQGRLSLTDPLSRFLPKFPNAAQITLAELLDHTAGISDAWDADACQQLDTGALVAAIARAGPDFPPGTAWRYSNAGYILLGAVIEKVTGTSWDRAEQEQVLAPLGLHHTGYYSDAAVVHGRVEGYSRDEAGRLTRPAFVTISGPEAAGGLTSTAEDLFRLVRGLNAGRLLSAASLEEMTSPHHTSDGHEVAYGDGVMLETLRGEPVLAHNGGIEGFASQYLYLPQEQITVVVLANTDSGAPMPRSIARRLAALAAGRPYRTFRDAHLTPAALQALVGTYLIEGGPPHVVALEDGRLKLRRGRGPWHELVPAQGDLLYFAGDRTDYFHVVRDARGRVLALDFFADGMAPARHEPRQSPGAAARPSSR